MPGGKKRLAGGGEEELSWLEAAFAKTCAGRVQAASLSWAPGELDVQLRPWSWRLRRVSPREDVEREEEEEEEDG